MGLLTLYAGLILPWLGGTLWLIFVDAHFNRNRRDNRFRQAGYGFFLGYAVLFLGILVSNNLTGTVSWIALMVFLLIFTASGGVAAWQANKAVICPTSPSQPSPGNVIKIMTSIMLLLMALHLVFIAIENFSQPVYPWDAWLAWVYRAKAWSLAGGLAEVVSPTDWIPVVSANTYTIDAWLYPRFPSVMPYWAALSLGNWSETLVGLPVLFAGVAIGMALYGQCREFGASVPFGLTACYLLYSIPLFGTHIALAGYADIWMAGFLGLGFMALMRGIISRGDNDMWAVQFVVGLLMITFAIWVKNEGAVWFLAALALLIVATYRPRVPILIVTSAVLAGWLVSALGYSHIDIPLIGTFGFVNNRFVIPHVASFALEMHHVHMVYLENFIKLGNWNLLWVLVAASLILGIFASGSVSDHRARRTAISFILIFAAIQVFIFGFTNQGMFADTYTSINRLPLHFTPALLFAVVVIVQTSLTRADPHSPGTPRQAKMQQLTAEKDHSYHLPRLLTATLLAAAIVMTGTVFILSKELPDQPSEIIQYPSNKLDFVFGSGQQLESRLLVNEFSNGYALVSSGPVNIQAATVRALSYTWIPPDMQQEAAFFWRRSDEAQNVLRTGISAAGTHLIDLANEPEWRGEISEFGFLLGGTNGEGVEIGEALLIPDSLKSRIQLTWNAWTTFEAWSQQSINFLYGGHYRQVVALPLLVLAWWASSALLFWLFSLSGNAVATRSLLTATGILFLFAWVMLDIRWSVNNVRQIDQTMKFQWPLDKQQQFSNSLDSEIYHYVQNLKNDRFGHKPLRILILGSDSASNYYLLRAKYHLLPHSVAVAGEFAKSLTPDSIDYVIFFGQANEIIRVPGWNSSWQSALVQVDTGNWGAVYRVK